MVSDRRVHPKPPQLLAVPGVDRRQERSAVVPPPGVHGPVRDGEPRGHLVVVGDPPFRSVRRRNVDARSGKGNAPRGRHSRRIDSVERRLGRSGRRRLRDDERPVVRDGEGIVIRVGFDLGRPRLTSVDTHQFAVPECVRAAVVSRELPLRRSPVDVWPPHHPSVVGPGLAVERLDPSDVLSLEPLVENLRTDRSPVDGEVAHDHTGIRTPPSAAGPWIDGDEFLPRRNVHEPSVRPEVGDAIPGGWNPKRPGPVGELVADELVSGARPLAPVGVPSGYFHTDRSVHDERL